MRAMQPGFVALEASVNPYKYVVGVEGGGEIRAPRAQVVRLLGSPCI